jgi:hypothetical protein
LWLSEVLGAELIIEAYKLVTVEISGVDSPRWGSGLVLNRSGRMCSPTSTSLRR